MSTPQMGVVSRLACSLTPSLAPSAMGSARRHSYRAQSEDQRDTSKHDSLGDRASSKLTLDDELFDILYAFGETDAFLGGKSDNKENETDEDGKPLTRQALLERIRQKKEVIGKLRCQAWSMSRKRRTLKLAQKYLEQNESKVSKSHLYMEEMKKRVRLLKRHFSNFKTYLIPWEGKIKRIESHFGSVVSSYFTFLRWIVFVNVIITLVIFAFVVMPEALADAAADAGRLNRTESRKEIPSGERVHADELAVVWHYDGYLRYSPLFYGYYSDDEFLGKKVRYALPLAYFIVTLFIFAYSFFAILRKMASNARMSKLSGSKAEQYIFNWRLFTGWDYSIGNQDTASNTVMAVVIKLRESIADSRVSQIVKFRCLQFSLRVFANVIICAMLAFSIYCISFAIQKSQTAVEQEGNLFTKNQVPTVVATITHVFPMIFDLIGRIENYHPRTALRAHLTRVLVLYVLNYVTFIVALFDKMDALRRKEPLEREEGARTKRQMGDRNPDIGDEIELENLPRPPPFASRTFENRSQMLSFMHRSTLRFDTNRTTRAVTPTPYTVAPQFGPVNVNNPSVIVRNGTFNKSFETNRLGPAHLPIFTPPPRTHPQQPVEKRKELFGGPDFTTARPPGRQQATVTPSRIRTRPPWQKAKGKEGAVGGGSTSMVKPDPTHQAPPLSNKAANPQLGDDIVLESTNDSAHLPEAAERKSNADEIYGSDICWETIIGQEIVKLVTMDLIVTILSILLIDFFRGLWIKYCASWWCWDIETTFPEYGEFKVAENVLHIINNQGMIWLGLFFAPMLPALNNIKLIVIMYIRGWAVMTCNVPAREIFRASRSSNFYLLILLLWLLLCTLPVGYVIASTRPSTSCGPFARHDHFYTVITNEIEKRVDATFLGYIRHVASPGVVIPILLFLMLLIYFLVSLVRGLREANTDLQQQLIHERTEEKKKIFELAGGGKKKTEAEQRQREKRRAIQYIPCIEQERREPWRTHDELDESIRASDSSSSDSSDAEGAESPVILHQSGEAPPTRIAPPPSSTAETVHAMQFHPSLGSLIENEPGEEEELMAARPIPHSMSLQSKVRFDSPSQESYDVQSNVVDIATPEEIRSILRPLLEMKYGSSMGTRGFPRDLSSPPTMIMTSSRSSKRNSYISLYDMATADNHLPTLVSSQALRDSHPEIHRSPLETTREEEEGNGSRKTSRFDDSTIQPQFQPWPSIDEVRARREQLMKRSPLSLGKALPSTVIGPPQPCSSSTRDETKPPIPVHRKYEQEAVQSGSGTEEERRSESPTKRFRISVSPTRRLTSEDREGSVPGRRRYVIKQESVAPSSASLASQSQTTKISPRAPRVEFGDDDSPRIQD